MSKPKEVLARGAWRVHQDREKSREKFRVRNKKEVDATGALFKGKGEQEHHQKEKTRFKVLVQKVHC